jgi:hypothetical protein
MEQVKTADLVDFGVVVGEIHRCPSSWFPHHYCRATASGRLQEQFENLELSV